MTPEQKKLHDQLFLLHDSPVLGEALASFEKRRALRDKMGFPTYGDMHRKVESAVTPEQLDEIKAANAGLGQQNDELTQENAAHRQNIDTLNTRVRELRAIAWGAVNFGRVVGVAVAVALLYGGYRWQTAAQAAPDKPPAASAAADKKQAAENAAFSGWLRGVQWMKDGDSVPVVVKAAGAEYWAVVRSSIDSKSHADTQGRPVPRHCLRVFAAPATRDATGFYLTAHPYTVFGLGWMSWDARSVECRNPNSKGYE